MPKYLLQASYTAEGAKGLIKDGGSVRRAIALTLSAGGGASVGTAVLMTPEEMDQAARKSPMYRAPGQ